MEHICKFCKHWERSTLYNNIGDCDSDKFVDVSDETNGGDCIPIDGVVFHDVEGWRASFDTGEAFGCIHWEPKSSV